MLSFLFYFYVFKFYYLLSFSLTLISVGRNACWKVMASGVEAELWLLVHKLKFKLITVTLYIAGYLNFLLRLLDLFY